MVNIIFIIILNKVITVRKFSNIGATLHANFLKESLFCYFLFKYIGIIYHTIRHIEINLNISS
jgi:hypothetical protein